MTATWQPGTTYIPGSIVQPTNQAAPGLTALVNADFESGSLTGWSSSGAGTWTVGGSAYQGSFKVTAAGGGIGTLKNSAQGPVVPGATISAQAMARLTNAGGVDDLAAEIALYWLDASHTFISQVEGANIHGVGGSWKPVNVSGVAPANAAFVQVVLGANTGSHGGNIDFDAVSWNSSYVGPPVGLVYKATQAAPGKSAATEPVWPNNTTTPVTDNTVTWQGVVATQLVWTASPINRSGVSEPAWPTLPGGSVHDGTIDWVATVPVITDPNCPHSKIVLIASSKVFAADNDIIRYSATVNPLDWSATDDAGYLPTGLQTYGDNPIAAMGLYRSNLVGLNAGGFQMWQLDEDPANIALMDALPIASTYNTALSPVANDLLFLSSEGVRSVGTSAAGVSLAAGDVGMPIDPMVQDALGLAAGDPTVNILACFVPSRGQYWLAFSNYPQTDLTITGDLPDGAVGKTVVGAYTVSGGTPPYAVTLNGGTFPVGMTLNGDGSYFGTYVAAGVYAWQIKVVDAAGTIGLKNDGANVGPMTISGDLGNGRSGMPVNYAYSSTGGLLPVAFTIASGTFPPGLTLNSDGTVTGTRTTQGTYNFLVRVTDAAGNHADLPDNSTTSAPYTWSFIAQPTVTNVIGTQQPVYADPVTGLVIGQDQSTGNLWTSANGGTTWVQHATGFSAGSSVYAVGASKGSLLAFSNNFGGWKRSTDLGVTWGNVLVGGTTAPNVECVISAPNAIFAGTGASGGVGYFSSDGGATWGTCTVPPSFNPGDSVFPFAGLYIDAWNTWVCPGQGKIYESSGAVPATWVEALTGTNAVGMVAYSPDLDMVVVSSNLKMYYRTRFGSWQSSVTTMSAPGGVCWCAPLGLFVACNAGVNLEVSSDGINWTPHTSSGVATVVSELIWSPVANQMLFGPGTGKVPYLSDI